MELLAQLVEEVSILAAEQRRRKPREIPRPKGLRGSTEDGIKHAVSVFKATARRVRR